MSDNLGHSSKKDVGKITKEDITEINKKLEKENDPMKLQEIQNWLKDKGVIDETKITREDVDKLYEKMEGKATDISSFIHELGKETKADMLDLQAKLQASLPEREDVSHALSAKKAAALKSIKELEDQLEEYAKSNTDITYAKMQEWFSSTAIVTKPPNKIKEEKSMNKEELKKFLEQIPSDEKFNIEEFMTKFDEWAKNEDGGSKE